MQWLADISIRRPVFGSVLVLTLVVVGAFSYFTLGIDRFPRVDMPVVSITTRYDGASGEEMETEVTDDIERAVNTISGIDELRSVSSEGVSQVFVQFVLEKDLDTAAQEVRDKVNQVLPDLPPDCDSPVIDKVDPDAAPVLQVAVSADLPIRDVSEFADKTLRRELESLSGVGQVLLIGARLRQIDLWLDPVRLRAYGLTVAQVADAVSRQNQEVPGGRIDQGSRSVSVRLEGRVPSVASFADLVVADRNGTPVRLGDVARVEDGAEEAETAGRIRGRPTVILAIRRQSGTNTVAVVRALKERLTEIGTRLPAGYALEIVRDQSEYIEASVHTVQEHLLVGGLLAAVVVWFFLRNWRSTLISALAIPTSIVSTFGLMRAMGLTLDMMTLLALTLAVGIVIDDAIVVLENIHRVMKEKRLSAMAAAREGTREIGLAVLATTLSLVAVFVPVAFMGGIVGKFLFSFGLTMAFSILVSLLVAFTLTPLLASRMLTADEADAAEPSGRFFHALENRYERLLRWAMAHRGLMVLACGLTLLSVVPLGMAVGKDFLPKNDESQFEVKVRAPEGTSLEQTELIGGRIARQIEALPGVAYAVVFVGDDDAKTRNLGSLFVKLVPVPQREHSQFEIMDQVRMRVLPQFEQEHLRTSVSPIAAISGGGKDNKDVAFFVSGPDTRRLGEYAERLTTALAEVPGVIDIDTSLILGKPELHVSIDRAKAADLGVQMADVGNTLRVLVGGDKVTDFDEGGERYEVHARSAPDLRTEVADLMRMAVPSAKLGSVSLDHVATASTASGASQIDRLGRRRQVTITANVKPGYSQQTALQALQQEAERIGMEPGYLAGVTGTSKEMGNAARNFVIAFVLSFVFMYLILAAQFESWIHPVTILIALPLTVPFALLSLLLFGQSLNIYTALGLLVLFGVVKKNAILQVDHTNALRAQGLSLLDATLRANRDRLRPILMTTVAFVAGMVPLLVSSGTGAGDNRAIGSVIFGGQVLSLLLTLLATPVFYSLFEDARTRFTPIQWCKRGVAAIARSVRRLRPTAAATGMLLGAAVLAAGCSAPEAVRPADTAPVTWRETTAAGASFADTGRWNLFGDERLGELITIALAENKDVAIAAARIAEQRALAAQAGSARWPTLDEFDSFETTRASTASVPELPPGVDNQGQIWKADLRLAWDLDLWGRLASADAAARADLLATEWARRGVLVTLVADVAQAWFDLLEIDAELAVARRTRQSREDSLFLVRRRREEDLASALDVARAEAEVQTAAALVPDLERRAVQVENRLSVLVGRNPGPIVRTTTLATTPVPPSIPAGLPSQLLARRPDLQEARAQLDAANARTEEAWADLFPDISLTGTYGSESAELSDLFSGPARTWRLGPSLTIPWFDAGRREAALDAAQARAEQAVRRFEKVVQQAFREVEDALVDNRKIAAVGEHQAALVTHLRRAHELADQRFREGVTAQLEVLDAQRTLLAAELDLARTQRNRLQAVVRLYAALGGGWQSPATVASGGSL